MTTRIGFLFSMALAVGLLLGAPESAAAYVGPGAGLTVIGAALAFIAGIALAIGGFVWYPIKRILRGRKDQSVPTE